MRTLPDKRVLVADGDAPLRRSLAEQLRLYGPLTADEAGTVVEARDLAQDCPPDAILLDPNLPDGDGRALCREWRNGGLRCPVVLLLTVSGSAARAAVSESRATDSLTKPFRLGMLLTRLHALLRQAEETAESTLAIGPYRFRPAAKLLLETATNRTVRLTDKEAAILNYLYRAGQQVIGRDVLLGEVWGYAAGVATHTLETHVYRLRRKIEANPSDARILVTEPGGYRLVR